MSSSEGRNTPLSCGEERVEGDREERGWGKGDGGRRGRRGDGGRIKEMERERKEMEGERKETQVSYCD